MGRTIHLMNSAMMPRSGYYCCYRISKESFANAFKELVHQFGWEWQSSIGYPQNAQILSRLLGCDVPVSMSQTVPGVGDLMMIMKLGYRTRDKGAFVDESEFEYWIAAYAGWSVDRLYELSTMIEEWADEQ